MNHQLGIKSRDDKACAQDFSVGTAQAVAYRLLLAQGIDSAMLDAQLLLAAVIKKSRIDVQLSHKQNLHEAELKEFFSLLSRRLCGEPVAYLLGKKEFFG